MIAHPPPESRDGMSRRSFLRGSTAAAAGVAAMAAGLATLHVLDADDLVNRSAVQGRVLRTLVAGQTVYQYGVDIRT